MDNASGTATDNVTSAEKFLQQMGVPYDVHGDGGIVVHGDLNLSRRGLKELPDLSNVTVTGNLDISNNHLQSLQGSPTAVLGNFNASYNDLKSLEGGPQSTTGNYTVQYNNLQDLKGAPQNVGGNFWAQHNQLTTVAGGPQEVGGDFFCYDNKLTSLDGGPHVAGRTHAGDVEAAAPQGVKTSFMQPPALPQPDGPGFSGTGGEPLAPAEGEGRSLVEQTRFSNPETIRKLLDAHQLINKKLNIHGVDLDNVKVKDAGMQGDWLNIQLQNGHTVTYGKRSDGTEFIGGTNAKAPFDATTAMACASLAKSKGWDNLQVNGTPEHQALLTVAAEKNGLKVANPPAQQHIDAARKLFETDAAPATPAAQAPKARTAAAPGR